jgi:hypothetical protein
LSPPALSQNPCPLICLTKLVLSYFFLTLSDPQQPVLTTCASGFAQLLQELHLVHTEALCCASWPVHQSPSARQLTSGNSIFCAATKILLLTLPTSPLVEPSVSGRLLSLVGLGLFSLVGAVHSPHWVAVGVFSPSIHWVLLLSWSSSWFCLHLGRSRGPACALVVVVVLPSSWS